MNAFSSNFTNLIYTVLMTIVNRSINCTKLSFLHFLHNYQLLYILWIMEYLFYQISIHIRSILHNIHCIFFLISFHAELKLILKEVRCWKEKREKNWKSVIEINGCKWCKVDLLCQIDWEKYLNRSCRISCHGWMEIKILIVLLIHIKILMDEWSLA